MLINYFRRSRKDMVIFARCSDTSLTEETGKGGKTEASLDLFCEDTVRYGGRRQIMLDPAQLLLVMQGKSCGVV